MSSVETMTKNELIKLVKSMKEEILALKSDVKEVAPLRDTELTETAVSVITVDNVPTLVKIGYNPDELVAKVIEILKYPNQPHVALYKANEALNTALFLKRRS